MGAIYKRGRVYWLKYYDHGRPIYESAQTRNREEKAAETPRGRPGEGTSRRSASGAYHRRGRTR